MTEMNFTRITGTSEDIFAIEQIWNASVPPSVAITGDFIAYNLAQNPIFDAEGVFVSIGERRIGLAILTSGVIAGEKENAWLELLCVLPDYQGTGVGKTLYRWIEDEANRRGAKHLRIGGGYRPFFAGIPDDLPAREFFAPFGYTDPSPRQEWDLVRDLASYQPMYPIQDPNATVRQLLPGDEPRLVEFINRAFPGRWALEVEDFLRIGGRISDFVGLQVGDLIEGFTWMTFADSVRPLNRYYMYYLPKPWGQIGPLGISKSVRGRGYSLPMIEKAILIQQASGVHGALIDWTNLLDLYAKFGYQPGRRYTVLQKRLQD